jgi:hypothetical protein
MKTRNIMKIMGFTGLLGCLVTYFFISFYNTQNAGLEVTPKKISYDEVHGPTFDRMNKLIAEQKYTNDSSFVNEMQVALQDLRVTKEIYQHSRNEKGSVPTYPLVILWGAIAAIGIFLLRSKEQLDKSIGQSYEKMLDHLEMTYSKDLQQDEAKVQTDKAAKVSSPAATNEV